MILVDSTRAGKRIPDALSKTVPIWCAVINRAVARRFPVASTSDWDNALYTPPSAVSNQEHHQIENRLDNWAEALIVSIFALAMAMSFSCFILTLAIIVHSSKTTLSFETLVDHSGDHNFPITPYRRPGVPPSGLRISIETNRIRDR